MANDGTRVEALLEAMTLDEKIGQLTMLDAGRVVTGSGKPVDMAAMVREGRAGSVFNLIDPAEIGAVHRLAVQESRLKIPLLVGLDVVHGHRTTFPIPLTEASAFDPDLWRRTARVAAVEAAADGINLTFAPMLDICRDPRWGRIAEGPGEDVLVARRFAEAKVAGFQDKALAAPGALAATAKHFAAYGAVTAGRDYAQVDISERLLREVYLPPFEAAVRAGVAAIMPAFTDIAGIPMTANGALLRRTLREQWGFDGVIVSDYGAVLELTRHGIAQDLPAASALALRAGVDIDMASVTYAEALPVALERGLLSLEEVDAAVRRVLALKERLGLFDAPHRGDAAVASNSGRREADALLAREAAQKSIVLLKNERAVLPLDPAVKRIALIGPLIDAREDMMGSWAALGKSEDTTTLLDGLRQALPDVEIVAVEAVDLHGGDREGISAALAAAATADAVILGLGEARSMSGEASCRAFLDLPGRQRELAEAILALGRPTIAVLMSGRPLTVEWLAERADAVVVAGFLGHAAGHALADVLTGRFNPSGRLPVSWPRAVGQIPVFYSHRPTGRPLNPDDYFTSKYLDLPIEPLFRFGDGLSFTTFTMTDVRLAASKLGPSDRLTVEVDVANEGPREGVETVFLFIRDPVASVSRPVLELKDFSKIALPAGGKVTLRLGVAVADLGHLDADLRPVLEAGMIEVLVGTSADLERLHRLTVEIVTDSPLQA